MEKERKKTFIIIVVILGVVLCLFPFWYRQHFTGSRNGKVIDAVTGEPIEGAVVNYAWHVSGFLEGAIGGGCTGAFYETRTNEKGEYYIPNQRVKRRNMLNLTLDPEHVVVYKDGYAVYTLWRWYKKPTVGRSFGYPDEDQPYLNKNNLVRLYPWKSGESHDQHWHWTQSQENYGRSVLLKEELKEEKKRGDEELRLKYRVRS